MLPSRKEGFKSSGRVADARAARDALVAHALETATQGNYRSLWTRYKRFCKETGSAKDSVDTISLFLAEGIDAGRLCKETASSCLTYIKIFSAVMARKGYRTRPLKPGPAMDVFQAVTRLLGHRSADRFENPTWHEVELLTEALELMGVWDLGVFVRVAWLCAARVVNLLAVRACDLFGDESELTVRFPSAKTDVLRIGMANTLAERQTRRDLLKLASRRLREARGRAGTRLWPITRATLMAVIRRADAGVTTARAFRRGFISAALACGFVRSEVTVAEVSHHLTLSVMGRYVDGVPRAEMTAQQRVATAALARQRRR